MLSHSEEEIKRAVEKSDTPFLGLLAENFTASQKEAIEIAVAANPSIDGYVQHLRRFPALFAVHLSAHVMQGLGQSGHFELYSHICRATGVRWEPSPAERYNLWLAFRHAILRLGFEPSPRTSGPHYMADEYLRQAGVPLAFVDDLAERMLTFAKVVGLPDENDPDVIARWQAALDAKLEQPFSRTARKAVALDSKGYYTQVFLRVHAAGGREALAKNVLERAMARALEKQPESRSFKRAVLPYLRLHQGTLGIFIPGGDERDFDIQEDGETETVRGSLEDSFIPTHGALPSEVSVRSTNGQSTLYRLWPDEKSNRFLLFTGSGRFWAGAQLNQPNPVLVPPGDYTVLSRFRPNDVETEVVCDDPCLYLFPVAVTPGKSISLSVGSAKAEIVGENQPYAQWTGSCKTTKEGVEFYFGSLHLNVQFPEEWLTIGGRNFVLTASAYGIGERVELPLQLDESGKGSIDMGAEALQRNWKLGFTRLLVEVSRPRENRTLLRTSTYFWNGLSSVSKSLVFELRGFPCNLVANLCENVSISNGLIKPNGGQSRTLRLVFQLDGRRNQTLTWNRPGLFIEIETPSESGYLQRHSYPLGSTEVVSYSSPKQLLISGSEPGDLCCGTWSQYFDFSKTQTKRLPAAFLASRITPHSNCLMFRNAATGVELELLRLVQTHYAHSISSQVSCGQLVVKIVVPKSLDAVAIHAVDVISGEGTDISLDANAGTPASHRFGRAQFMCVQADAGRFAAYVYLDLAIWPEGGWVLQFDGNVDGVWGHLENTRQDQFAIGFLCNGDGGAHDQKVLPAKLAELSDKHGIKVLRRVDRALKPCYSVDSWASLQWLAEAWGSLVRRWKGREHDAISSLINMAACCSPDDASASWMLQQTVGSSLPSIFALRATAYNDVRPAKHPFPSSVSVLARFNASYPAVFGNLLHPASAAGFINFSEVARGGRPKGFSIRQYVDGLRATGAEDNTLRLYQDDFSLTDGDYLGPIHLKYALRQLEEKYDRSLTGNEIRRGQAIGLCHFTQRILPKLTSSGSPRLAGCTPHNDPWDTGGDEAVHADLAQRRQNLLDFCHFLSWLAYHCRLDAKVPGELDGFLRKVHESGSPIPSSLAFLLQVGDAIFGYYLVFWELVIRAEHIGG